jgi:hypothetical protein
MDAGSLQRLPAHAMLTMVLLAYVGTLAYSAQAFAS